VEARQSWRVGGQLTRDDDVELTVSQEHLDVFSCVTIATRPVDDEDARTHLFTSEHRAEGNVGCHASSVRQFFMLEWKESRSSVDFIALKVVTNCLQCHVEDLKFMKTGHIRLWQSGYMCISAVPSRSREPLIKLIRPCVNAFSLVTLDPLVSLAAIPRIDVDHPSMSYPFIHDASHSRSHHTFQA
jgi:hypothetical protein